MPPSQPPFPADDAGVMIPSSGETFPEWMARRALRHPDRQAVVFIDDEGKESSLTYQELWRRSSTFAERLPQATEQSPRALLLFPPGLEFLVGFLGCQVAGWTPVPTCYPKGGREMPRLDSAADDCSPAAIVADRETLQGLDPDRLSVGAKGIARIATDAPAPDSGRPVLPDEVEGDGESLALLQYTSGSTSEPRGVMVRHSNLMANLEAIRRGFQVDWQPDRCVEPERGVFWLPFFHDMGLIGGILSPLYVGGTAILMSPRSFLKSPLRWLKWISEYRASISGAPNFAYQLCLDRIAPEQASSLDLSCWKTAFCGAEPISARTLSSFAARFSSCGFQASSFYPCYGLAEATLLAAGGAGPSEPGVLTVDRAALADGEVSVSDPSRGSEQQKLVSCGRPAAGIDLVIVDPVEHQPLAADQVGEIWLTGTSVTDGYWGRPEENAESFRATLAADSRHFCRTGDLGFIHDGELYVTGRRKDVIILRGRNHFPQDIEATVKETVGGDWGLIAAFSTDGPRGEALAIVAEVPRGIDEATLPHVVREIRRTVIDVHEIDPRHVLFVRAATIPLTTSGKIQRSRCRQSFEGGEIKARYRYDRASGSEQTPIAMPELPSAPDAEDAGRLQRLFEDWMSDWLIVRAGLIPEDIDLNKPFAEYGLDSMTAVELSGELEDWSGVELTPIVAWNYPTIGKLSAYISQMLTGTQSDIEESQAGAGEIPLDADPQEHDLEKLLGEVERLSEDEVDHAFAEKRRP